MIKSLHMTLPSLRAAYAEGVTPSDVVAEVYARIEALADPALFLHLRDKAEVLSEAASLPEGGALRGIPFVIKDNIDLAGAPTTAACPDYAYTPDRDAFVVAQLRAAGALVIGKTNLDQFATGLVGVRSPYGVPRNSVDPDLVPGGSSSGSATAVGHGLVAFSLGTDTAGSGRVPAALNDIVGLKPSLGALSASGVVPACRTLDTISIFARTVADASEVFAVANAYDPADAYCKPVLQASAAGIGPGLRIGVPTPETREFFGDTTQSAMFSAALTHLAKAGAEIVQIDFTPFHDTARMLYEGAWVAERHTVVEHLMRDKPDALHPTTALVIGAAEKLSAADAFRGIYRLKELERLAKQALDKVDLLCVPTIPTFYTLEDLEADPVTPNSNLGTYTNFVNLLDMCGLAVPTAPRSDGRPGSVTLLAPGGHDTRLAQVARVFEDGATLSQITPSGLREDEIAIAVCGAHMSGLPLNHELTSRGARLLRSTETAPRYRLYALAGGPPQRPGMLRIEKGQAIALEVWALPKPAFGAFIAGVPAPLSIGTIALADGTEAHGFLVEAAGTQGAEDITHHGSWRAYLAGTPVSA